MFLSQISLYQFRSHHQFKTEFRPGVSIIVGQNGIGKTNLLEAIYVLFEGSSFRDGDSQLIEHGCDDWHIKAVIDGLNREVKYNSGKKTTSVDDKVYSRLPKSKHLPVVLFEPDHLMLIHAQPGARREFVDSFLANISVQFSDSKKRYERALRQRNKLLKAPQLETDTIFVWDLLLAREGAYIRSQRQRLVDQYSQKLSDIYSQIAGAQSTIKIEYKSSLPRDHYEQTLISELKHRLERDNILGFTSVGVHRDDVRFWLDDQDMALNASRGEIRSLILSLKRFEADIKHNIFETAPLILLDDVASELDPSRQQQLLGMFDNHQVIITATDVPKRMREVASLIRM